MEMQMITGSSLLTTHWAYMAPYNPAVFTPPSPTQYVPANVASPQWNFTAGTTWRLRQPGAVRDDVRPAPSRSRTTTTATTGAWGAAPVGNAVGNFTVLGLDDAPKAMCCSTC